jgi:hypothetical protein
VIGKGDGVADLVGDGLGVVDGEGGGVGVDEAAVFGGVVHAVRTRTRTSNTRILTSVSCSRSSDIRLGARELLRSSCERRRVLL